MLLGNGKYLYNNNDIYQVKRNNMLVDVHIDDVVVSDKVVYYVGQQNYPLTNKYDMDTEVAYLMGVMLRAFFLEDIRRNKHIKYNDTIVRLESSDRLNKVLEKMMINTIRTKTLNRTKILLGVWHDYFMVDNLELINNDPVIPVKIMKGPRCVVDAFLQGLCYHDLLVSFKVAQQLHTLLTNMGYVACVVCVVCVKENNYSIKIIKQYLEPTMMIMGIQRIK